MYQKQFYFFFSKFLSLKELKLGKYFYYEMENYTINSYKIKNYNKQNLRNVILVSFKIVYTPALQTTFIFSHHKPYQQVEGSHRSQGFTS